MTALAGMVASVAGCGGNASQADGPGTDEEYVAALCKASSRFASNFLLAASDPDNQADHDAQIDATVEVLEQFSEDLAEARPPGDLVAFHGDMVTRSKEMIDEIKRSRSLKAMDGGPGPDWPPGALERLEPIADEERSCKIGAFPFG